jgi:hypothetical protein
MCFRGGRSNPGAILVKTLLGAVNHKDFFMDCFNHRENALATLTAIVGGGFATTIYKKFVGIHQPKGEDHSPSVNAYKKKPWGSRL